MTVDIVFGSLNTHRADCNKDHYHPCRDWDDGRGDELADWIYDTVRASTYAFQECLHDQAVTITSRLGWGDEGNPAFVEDENHNVIAYDRKKWTDVGVYQLSLSHDTGDKGDQHRRSILWVLLEHISSGRRGWFGSAHLENGDSEERAREANRLVEALPPSWPAVFGVDRNSYTTSEDQPRDIFEDAGLEELVPDNPDNQRSFNQWDHSKEPKDGKSIDGIHTLNMTVRGGEMLYTTGLDLTDHSALKASLTI